MANIIITRKNDTLNRIQKKEYKKYQVLKEKRKYKKLKK
jgi:hypothetical protein